MEEQLQEFTEHVKKVWEQKAAVEAIKERLKEESKKFEQLKFEAMKAMEAGELDKFNVPGFGTIYRQKKFSAKVPKDADAKEALFEYIRSQKGEDVLLNLLSINSNTLNSFYKEEREQAVERGDIDWNLPGVSEPEIYFQLGMRKS